LFAIVFRLETKVDGTCRLLSYGSQGTRKYAQ